MMIYEQDITGVLFLEAPTCIMYIKYISLQEGIAGISYKGRGSEDTGTLSQIFTQVLVFVAMSNLFLFKPVVLTLGDSW